MRLVRGRNLPGAAAGRPALRGRLPWRWRLVQRLLPATLGAWSLAVAPGAVRSDEPPPPFAGAVDYATQVAPIFREHCLGCHGADDPAGGLRLDRRAALLRGGDSGEPAIVVGDGAASHLWRLVAGLEAGRRMPPDGEPPLSAAQLGVLRAWIDQGASWPGPDGVEELAETLTDHWSFRPLGRVEVPALPSTWGRNAIDAFVAAKLQEQGLAPNPPAERATLIRRMTLDVWGLPPAPAAVEEFQGAAAADADADADALVETLLASPHYGERWARHWLDLVRFAETDGFETNRLRPHAWRYRDYVIESLNADKPYDQFLREQLAGDAYGNWTALGFLVAGPYDIVKSPDPNLTEMQRLNELDDMLSTTSTALLGLTIGCARCHNHKFDPISQADYYALQAIFAGVRHGDAPLPRPPADERRLAEIDRAIGDVQRELAKFLRPPVSAAGNVETFAPHRARFVRFTITQTNSGEPCLDELEVFAGAQNVALAEAGARATASGSLTGYPIHRLEHLHDGQYGNGRSWISDEAGRGWVQIEFAEPHSIDRIAWARDREGQFADRVPLAYTIETSLDGQTWRQAATADDRLPFGEQLTAEAVRQRCADLGPDRQEAAVRHVAALEQLVRERQSLVAQPLAYAGLYEQPGPTHRLYRGEPFARREQVAPDVPAALGDLGLAADAPEAERRRALADWIASPANPLTARVIVNRLWQFHFGQALTPTPSDWGAAGALPSHPELLDWLASELIDHGWSLKHIHRLILQSATYRQSSAAQPRGMDVDAGARWLWRFPPRRLEAEPIRDSILAVSGSLDLTAGGPGFSAFEVEPENVHHYHPKTSFGPEDWRRMIYMTKVRMEQDAVFGLFDCPDAATSVPKRFASTTPLQALNLLNSAFLIQQAERFAARLQRDAPGDAAAQIDRAYRLCYARGPDAEEIAAGRDFVAEYGLPAFCRALVNSNEFLFLF